jgi:outer membrane protein with beta-barrel domain
MMTAFRVFKMVPLAALLSFCTLAAPAWAQNREKAWEINPYFGSMRFEKVDGAKLLDDTWDLGFRFGYHWTKHQMVEFGFFGGSTDSPDIDVTVDLLGGQIDYLYNFFVHRRDKVVLYPAAGIGVLNTSSFGFLSDPEAIGDKIHSSWNIGGGIRLFGGARTGFRFDVRRVSFSDSGQTVVYLEPTIGLTVVLGGAY